VEINGAYRTYNRKWPRDQDETRIYSELQLQSGK
jgi:hypothetical protein